MEAFARLGTGAIAMPDLAECMIAWILFCHSYKLYQLPGQECRPGDLEMFRGKRCGQFFLGQSNFERFVHVKLSARVHPYGMQCPFFFSIDMPQGEVKTNFWVVQQAIATTEAKLRDLCFMF